MGLLAGATDVEENPLTAAIFSNPSNGTVTIDTDGSFEYVPAANFEGTDSFQFVTNDGSDDSVPATATFEVTPFDEPGTIVIPSEFSDPTTPAEVNVGQAVSFVIDVDDPDDADEDYVFQLDLEDSGISESAAQPTIDSSTGQFDWTPTEPGSFEIRVIAVNSDGEPNQETFLVDVLEQVS